MFLNDSKQYGHNIVFAMDVVVLVIILAYLLVTRDPLLSPCEGEAGYVLRLAFFPLYMPFMKKWILPPGRSLYPTSPSQGDKRGSSPSHFRCSSATDFKAVDRHFLIFVRPELDEERLGRLAETE